MPPTRATGQRLRKAPIIGRLAVLVIGHSPFSAEGDARQLAGGQREMAVAKRIGWRVPFCADATDERRGDHRAAATAVHAALA